MNVAIFSCDPGGHSGLAWGVFDHYAPVGDALRGRMQPSGSDTVEGSWLRQAAEIANRYKRFKEQCVKQFIPYQNVEFVCEDFVQRPGLTSGGADGTLPLVIIGALAGYRLGAADEYEKTWGPIDLNDIIYQPAQQATTFATGPRLREWGVWVRGREHERSAWKHIALRLATINKNKLYR